MTKFIAHADAPRTFADKKTATKAIKRDLAKHDVSHGDILFETGFDVQQSGDRFGVILYCDLTADAAQKLVGTELSGYVIEPSLKAEPAPKPTPTTATPDAPKKAPRRKGQVTVAPTFPLIQCREGSKQQAIIDALANGNVWDQPFNRDDKNEAHHGNASLVGGATLADLRNVCTKKDGVTPWDDNSIRSALYYDLKDKGYGITTRFIDDVPHYSLVLPVRVDAPMGPKVKSS